MFEESLHGVMVGFWQLSDQVFDGMNSLLVVWILCRKDDEKKSIQFFFSKSIFFFLSDVSSDANVCEIYHQFSLFHIYIVTSP